MNNTRRNFIKKAGAAGLLLALPKAINTPYKTEKYPARKIIKPLRLKPGSHIALTAPAGAIWDKNSIQKFKIHLLEAGYKVSEGKTLYEQQGYLAGSDDLRANELNEFFNDKNIHAVFCMRGGWGCARLFEKLDYTVIADNPKILLGFSDITSLLLAIYNKTGLVGFHGPTGNTTWNDFTKIYFKQTLIEAALVKYLSQGQTKVINQGKTQGKLIGGNLSVFCSLVGTPYLPDCSGAILFLEEVEEEPFRIDRMFTQLKQAGILNRISGFVFGNCNKCLAEEPHKAFTFEEIIRQHISPLKIPAFIGADFGHTINKFTLPIGISATLDANLRLIKLNETAVL
jgi:muramoyltetrapeptide carboxypeptidase